MSKDRRTPLQPRSKERVELILDIAAELIASEGLEALTTTTVAERAEIPIGTLYQYFSDREAIIATLVGRHLKTMNDQIVDAVSQIGTLTIESLVRTAINAHVEFYRANPSFMNMWFHGRLSSSVVNQQRTRNEELGRWLRAIADQFGMIVEDAPELGAWFAVEIGDRVLEMAFRRDPKGNDEVIEAGIEMIARYLGQYSTDAGRGGVSIAVIPRFD